MEQEPRYVSKEEMQRMRESVKKGVERVVHPFLRRVEAQSHIRPSKVKYKGQRWPNVAEQPLTPTQDNCFKQTA
ncbi:hypothetical protein A3J17_02015 [Candidatus Curtissbacteria bacterium RIFCSPLOWO2_02_FULL_40_11]|uniref:Uncharacterized protein n=2 Tax=Candidatus Curtissiibacteriota TaxID=1752717 RepID=A0A1F5GB59_9BACT|nr:MAG: hypothetical protein A3D04_05080 [Candidatus Curtissbacteria bacterium RIFCSPHIGHO2_02_FULL_40_16b]OGE00551.1 MAG: hypothetical protein A3J17_02015 [Candidatus Curtissbacteria bacterium RIFCSPLOWO2_02_FULL_40_11]OGE13398.1 MAG: hypothetical protein A3G14_02935 [Candidatus Curtissbacteria bacterium RIFCSPLOWO2_12_FULL_38_9]